MLLLIFLIILIPLNICSSNETLPEIEFKNFTF